MSNSRVRESLERLHRVFLERPAAAKKSNPPATATWQNGLRCEVTGITGRRSSPTCRLPWEVMGLGRTPAGCCELPWPHVLLRRSPCVLLASVSP